MARFRILVQKDYILILGMRVAEGLRIICPYARNWYSIYFPYFRWLKVVRERNNILKMFQNFVRIWIWVFSTLFFSNFMFKMSYLNAFVTETVFKVIEVILKHIILTLFWDFENFFRGENILENDVIKSQSKRLILSFSQSNCFLSAFEKQWFM